MDKLFGILFYSSTCSILNLNFLSRLKLSNSNSILHSNFDFYMMSKLLKIFCPWNVCRDLSLLVASIPCISKDKEVDFDVFFNAPLYSWLKQIFANLTLHIACNRMHKFNVTPKFTKVWNRCEWYGGTWFFHYISYQLLKLFLVWWFLRIYKLLEMENSYIFAFY